MNYSDEAKRNLGIEWRTTNGIDKIYTVSREGLDEGSDEKAGIESLSRDINGNDYNVYNILIIKKRR